MPLLAAMNSASVPFQRTPGDKIGLGLREQGLVVVPRPNRKYLVRSQIEEIPFVNAFAPSLYGSRIP